MRCWPMAYIHALSTIHTYIHTHSHIHTYAHTYTHTHLFTHIHTRTRTLFISPRLGDGGIKPKHVGPDPVQTELLKPRL